MTAWMRALPLSLLVSALACAGRAPAQPKPAATQPAGLTTRKPEQIAGPPTRDLGKLAPVPGAASPVDERDRRGSAGPGRDGGQ